MIVAAIKFIDLNREFGRSFYFIFSSDKNRCKILSLSNDTISEESLRVGETTTKTIQSICI